MERILKYIAVFALVLSFCASFAACGKKGENEGGNTETDIVLAENGSTEYSIVIPAEADPTEEYASELLQKQFEAATGAKIAIEKDDGAGLDESKKVLSVGNTSILKGSGVVVDAVELNEDGFKIKRFGNTVVMGGYNGTGTIYSVQEFLKYEFDYEVYATDEIYIATAEKSMLIDFDITDAPDFQERGFDGLATYNAEYAVSLRLGASTQAAEFDYGTTRDWIGSAHSYYEIIPKEKYNNPDDPENYHPDWFSASQLCFTADGIFETFVANLKTIIKENPYGKIVSLGENDGAGYCTCDACMAEQSQYGLSGYIIRFMNRVVTETEKDPEISSRNLMYSMFAYTASGSIIPPVNTSTGAILDESCRPVDDLYIRFTPLNPVCYKHAWSDPDCSYNQKIYDYLQGWDSITDNLFVWDYNTNFSAYYFFYDNFDSLQKNLQLYKEVGVINLTRENTTGSSLRSLTDLDTYLNAKLMWDVNADVGALMDDFMEHYYKDGAEYMWLYINLMRSNVNMMDETLTEGYHLLCYQAPGDLVKYWPKRVLEQALDLLEKAQDAYLPLKDTDPVLYETMYNRVLKESVCLRYMILSNFSTYYPGNTTLLNEMLDQFEIDAETVQATCDHEGGGLTDFIDSLRG